MEFSYCVNWKESENPTRKKNRKNTRRKKNKETVESDRGNVGTEKIVYFDITYKNELF